MARRNVFVVGDDYNIKSMYRSHGYNVIDHIDRADIVQFIGGADVDPRLYGEIRLASTRVSEGADSRDENAWEKSKGKFRAGICRGGQFLNVKSGGKMWQHVDGHSNGRGHLMRDVLFNPPDPDMEHTFHVSSTHHQLMSPSEDGEILGYALGLASNHKSASMTHPQPFDPEIVWYNKTNALCFQPHPEYNGYRDCTKHFFSLIDYFMK